MEIKIRYFGYYKKVGYFDIRSKDNLKNMKS